MQTLSPLQAAPEDVYGEHGHGYCRFTGRQIPTTFLFADEAKTRQRGWVRGHVEDGALVPGPYASTARRVLLADVTRAEAA